MSAPTVTVVICTYTDERWSELVEAVRSAARQDPTPLEVIVVVDGDDTLLERVRSQLSGVVAVANAQARGLSGARNTGVGLAKGEVIAFLDDDAMAVAGWLAGLCVHYADPLVLGVGGTVEPMWLVPRPAWFPAEFHWVVGCSYAGMPETAAPVRNMIGANMSFRRQVFEGVGSFSSAVGRVGVRPSGCEETELCIRAGQRWPSARFVYEPRAVVRHRVPKARVHWRYFLSRCWSEGRSKAVVAAMVGRSDGLSAERRHAFRVLPASAASALVTAVRRRQPALAGQAAAIIGGLATTASGYAVGTLVRSRSTGDLR